MIKTYVCNLERYADRKRYVLDTYPKVLDIEIITAYDGYNEHNSPELEKLAAKFKKSYENNRDNQSIKKHFMLNPLSPGEFGCLVSFLSILERIIHGDEPYAVYTDDDMKFEDNFSESLTKMIQNFLLENFKIIYLTVGNERNHSNAKNIKINEMVSERDISTMHVDSMLLISKKGAIILYDLLFTKYKGCLGRDYAINELCKEYNHKTHIIYPTIAYCDNPFGTTIQISN